MKQLLWIHMKTETKRVEIIWIVTLELYIFFLLNMVNSACACLFSWIHLHTLTCLRLTDMTVPSCKMPLINTCNIKTDWGIVVQQDGTTSIFIVPLRLAGWRIRSLKLCEVNLWARIWQKKMLILFPWNLAKVTGFWSDCEFSVLWLNGFCWRKCINELDEVKKIKKLSLWWKYDKQLLVFYSNTFI